MSPTTARGRPRVAVAAMVAALLGIGVGACGSGTRVSGRGVFAADCAICHSTSGSSAPEQQGGDLRHLHLPRYELVQYTAEMPVVNKPLTTEQLRAVVSYVQLVERRR